MNSFDATPSLAVRRIAATLFCLLVLATAFAAGLHTVSDFDMGWHMATGRWVMEHHQIPRTDVLSLTAAGQPWAYPPFAGVLFYLVYQAFGYTGLSWFSALCCLSVAAYLMRRRDVFSAVLVMLATQSIAARMSPRADLFSTLLFALVLGELWAAYCAERARLWLLPLLLFLWVNLHPGFIAGLAAIAAYVLAEMLQLLASGSHKQALARIKRAAPWLVASVAVTLLNPWGWRIYQVTGVLSGAAGSAQGKINSTAFIGEYQNVPVGWHMLGQLADPRHIEHGFTCLLVFAVLLVLLALWHREWGPALLLSVALYGGLAHARSMAMFTLCVVIVGGALLRQCFAGKAFTTRSGLPSSATLLPQPVQLALLAILSGLAALHLADYLSSRTYIVYASDWRFGAGASNWLPLRAADFIKITRLPGNVFEEYALGGFAAFHLGPQYPDYLDGRSDRLRPDLVAQQRQLYSAPPDSAIWQQTVRQWNLNVVLIATSGIRSLQKLSPAAFCASQQWSPVYADDSAMVFLRNSPENQPWLDRYSIRCQDVMPPPPPAASRTRLYDYSLSLGALFFGLGRDAESERMMRWASQLEPADPNVHLLLASWARRHQQWPVTESELRTSLALGSGSGGWQALGSLLSEEGRGEEAEQALQKAASASPQPTDIYLQLAELELILNHPERAMEAYAKVEQNSPYRNGGEALVPGLYAQIAEGRSEAFRMEGNMPEAIRQAELSVQLTPNSARRWQHLAQFYQAAGQPSRATEALQRAAALMEQARQPDSAR